MPDNIYENITTPTVVLVGPASEILEGKGQNCPKEIYFRATNTPIISCNIYDSVIAFCFLLCLSYRYCLYLVGTHKNQ